mmetsp:Transcript_24856/g.94006  ORF Transcript_24856/g.94006 Transcript_24856/m.94006 type:complete len:206 (+) Transcript_24856:1182-1799(+)
MYATSRHASVGAPAHRSDGRESLPAKRVRCTRHTTDGQRAKTRFHCPSAPLLVPWAVRRCSLGAAEQTVGRACAIPRKRALGGHQPAQRPCIGEEDEGARGERTVAATKSRARRPFRLGGQALSEAADGNEAHRQTAARPGAVADGGWGGGGSGHSRRAHGSLSRQAVAARPQAWSGAAHTVCVRAQSAQAAGTTPSGLARVRMG